MEDTAKFLRVQVVPEAKALVDLEVLTFENFSPRHLLARKSGDKIELLQVSLVEEQGEGGSSEPKAKKKRSLAEAVMARSSAAPVEGDTVDILRAFDGRARSLHPLLSLPWTPENSELVASYLITSTVTGYEEHELTDMPSVCSALRLWGLPPMTVHIPYMEVTPGGFVPGTRGYEAYWKLPPDETDLSFGQAGDDYMGGELPPPLTAEERSARALKLQSLLGCFKTATHILQQKKSNLGNLAKLWAQVLRPEAGAAAAAASAVPAAAAAAAAASAAPAAAAAAAAAPASSATGGASGGASSSSSAMAH